MCSLKGWDLTVMCFNLGVIFGIIERIKAPLLSLNVFEYVWQCKTVATINHFTLSTRSQTEALMPNRQASFQQGECIWFMISHTKSPVDFQHSTAL